jgi:opacity protein-like surface antigen
MMVASGSGSALGAESSSGYGESYYIGPEAYLEFAAGFVSHDDGDFPGELKDGAAADFAVGINSRLDERFSHGFKVTLDSTFDATATCEVSFCNGEKEKFSVTSLAGNYDLDWRFTRRLSLLASVGAGAGWSDLFEDNVELMLRGSVGLGFHVTRQLQLTVSGAGNFFPSNDDDYAIIRGMFGLRWAWDS